MTFTSINRQPVICIGDAVKVFFEGKSYYGVVVGDLVTSFVVRTDTVEEFSISKSALHKQVVLLKSNVNYLRTRAHYPSVKVAVLKDTFTLRDSPIEYSIRYEVSCFIEVDNPFYQVNLN